MTDAIKGKERRGSCCGVAARSFKVKEDAKV